MGFEDGWHGVVMHRLYSSRIHSLMSLRDLILAWVN